MEQVDKKKRQMTSQLKKLRNKYIASIYDDLIKKKNLAEIHKGIKNISKVANQEGISYTKNMEKFVLNLASKTKKKLDKNIPSLDLDGGVELAIANWVYGFFDKQEVFSKTNSISYDVATHYESERKDELLKLEVNRNRHYENPRVFYLASSHNDCASDHKDYQGKIYIDEKWKDLVKDLELKVKILQYVNANNVKTFQWVIGKPVWFITRPNCRHYMKSLTTEDVLGNSVSTLTRNHKLHTQVGKELTRTIKHPTNKGWYKKENIEDIIDKYKERLEFHQALWEIEKSQPLKRAIEKDKLLIQKWEKMLQTI